MFLKLLFCSYSTLFYDLISSVMDGKGKVGHLFILYDKERRVRWGNLDAKPQVLKL